MDVTKVLNTINDLYNENNSIDSFKLYITYNQKKKYLIITSVEKGYFHKIFLKNITTTQDIIKELDKAISKRRYKI